MIITVEEYRNKYPLQQFTTSGGAPVEYRYHKNQGSDKTLVLLIGTIGNSDAFYEHFELLSKDFSVITLDYPEKIKTVAGTADALAELFQSLGVKVWLLGQSLGGFVAQVTAKKHPEVVEGLVLSNTASLGKHMSSEGIKALNEMLMVQNVNQKLVSFAPMRYIKSKLLVVDPQLEESFTPQQKEYSDAFAALADATLSRGRIKHSLTLLTDLASEFGMAPEDVDYLNGRVLLLLSPDDRMFHKDCTDALTRFMPFAQVDRSLTGGHLAMFLQPAEYVEKVRSFVLSR